MYELQEMIQYFLFFAQKSRGPEFEIDYSEYDVSKDRLGSGGAASLSSWLLTL